jgi:hypothetical protein
MFLFLAMLTLTTCLWLYIALADLEEKGTEKITIRDPPIARNTRRTTTQDCFVSVDQKTTLFGYFDSRFTMAIPLAYFLLFLTLVWFLKPSNFELLSSVFLVVPLSYGTLWLLKCSFYTNTIITRMQVKKMPNYAPPLFDYDFPPVFLFGR